MSEATTPFEKEAYVYVPLAVADPTGDPRDTTRWTQTLATRRVSLCDSASLPFCLSVAVCVSLSLSLYLSVLIMSLCL